MSILRPLEGCPDGLQGAVKGAPTWPVAVVVSATHRILSRARLRSSEVRWRRGVRQCHRDFARVFSGPRRQGFLRPDKHGMDTRTGSSEVRPWPASRQRGCEACLALLANHFL